MTSFGTAWLTRVNDNASEGSPPPKDTAGEAESLEWESWVNVWSTPHPQASQIFNVTCWQADLPGFGASGGTHGAPELVRGDL